MIAFRHALSRGALASSVKSALELHRLLGEKLVLTREAPCLQSGSCSGEHCAMYGTLSDCPRLSFPRKSAVGPMARMPLGGIFFARSWASLEACPTLKSR